MNDAIEQQLKVMNYLLASLVTVLSIDVLNKEGVTYKRQVKEIHDNVQGYAGLEAVTDNE